MLGRRKACYSPEKMRMVSIPDLNWSDPWRGLGVVGREGMGVIDLERMPFSLASGGYESP